MKLLCRASLRRLVVLAVSVLALTFAHASPAFSQVTHIVTNTDDDGPGSLRQTIAEAAGGDTITFDIPDGGGGGGCGCGPGGEGDVIFLETGELLIDKNLTIIGPTGKGLAISGDFNSRVILVAPFVSLSLSNVVISEGVAFDGLGGGGILSYGELTLSHVLVVGNITDGEGGGINSEGTSLTIFNSTISGNASFLDGGGLLNCNETTALLVNVTIADNISDLDQDGFGSGGGIGQVSTQPITLVNTIVAYNMNGDFDDDDVFVYDDEFDDAFDSVLDPASHHNLIRVGTGFTVIPGVTGIVNGENGNLVGTPFEPMEPRLGSLDSNGSPLYSYQPQHGSPVFDAGDNAAAAAAGLTTDQRGFPRVLDSGDADTVATVDMGSFEARVSVGIVEEITIAEDTGLILPFNVGDLAHLTGLDVSSRVPFIIPNNAANLLVTGTGASRTLTIAPVANAFGTVPIDLLAEADPDDDSATAERFGAILLVNIAPVADTPSVTNASTFVGVQTTSGLVITPNVADGAEVEFFRITAITGGTLYKNDGSTVINSNEYIAVAEGLDGLKFTPAGGFSGNATFQVQGALNTLGDGLSPAATAIINVVYPSSTTVVSANPNPSDQTQPIPVLYTVDSGGPTPTGTVTVTISGGSESCTGTVAAGQCTLTPTVAGTRDIIATYSGDGVTAASVSDPLAHTVDVCTVNPVVTSAADSGAGSLRAAVAATCYGSTITFNIAGAGPHTILLSSGALTLAKNVTITGSDEGIRLSGNHLSQIIAVNGGVTAALNRLTLVDGVSVTGGALRNTGTLTMTGSTLSNNLASVGGGAIVNSGAMTLINSTLTGNSADTGGGILNSGPLSLVHVTIAGNAAFSDAGGLSTGTPVTIANTIIAGNTAPTAANVDGALIQSGNNMVSGDPRLGPLADHGGPTWTMMPMTGSPVLDAGDNTIATDDGLTTDQRGAGFGRILDSADANATQTVDLGAVEADPTLPAIADRAIGEDATDQFIFNVGDAASLFDTIVASSGNTTLLPNLPANIEVTGSGSTRTLTLTPAADQSGTSLVTITATKTVGGVVQTAETSFTLTVNAQNDPPTLAPIADPAAILEDSTQQTINFSGITAGPNESQTLTVTATSDNPALIPHPTVTYVSPNATGSLAYTPVPNASGSTLVTVTVTDDLGSVSGYVFTVAVTPVADTPSITDTSTPISTQTTSGLVVSRNPADGAEVTHFRVTGITSGTVFQHDGTTPIASGSFITAAQGAAGLRFTPLFNSMATGHFTIRASTSDTVSGLGGSTVTANIVINALQPSTTAVATSGSPSTFGQTVTFIATVTPADAAASGTVQFMDGAAPLGSPVPLLGGLATHSTSTLAVGVHAITAVYSGNPLAAGSTGTLAGGQTVRDPGTVSLITGADAGASPLVRRFMALDGSVPPTGALNSFLAFDPSFTGGVRVAEGDVNGDGVPDYIAGAGPGGAPEVRIVDGATGANASLVPFEPEFRGGVFVAAGDVNGDGFVDVIAGSGEGRAGQVKVFSGRDFSILYDLPVFEPAFTGGVRVAAGDVNADGFADLVVAAGIGASTVTVLSGASPSVITLHTFTAYPAFTGGVFVAAGDVTGDGFADIVTGAGAGGGPHVRVFDGRTAAEVHGFFPFDPSFAGGVRVAAGDVNGDGHAEVIAAAGPGGAPEVRVVDPTSGTLLHTELAYAPGFAGGVFVATAVPVLRMAIDTPLADATVRSGFTVSGWAFEDSATPAGFTRLDLVANPAGGGAPVLLSSATMGDPRPDVGAIYGSRYTNSGFHFPAVSLAPGTYDLAIVGVGVTSGQNIVRRTVRITVALDPPPLLAIDIPTSGLLPSGDFAVGGWALTLGNPAPPGVDAVHVWASPVDGGAWQFLGSATLGVPRPDVAVAFGPQYALAGYYLTVTGLAAGAWDLHVFPRATGNAAFAAARVVRVVVAGGPPRTILTGADAGGGAHVRRFSALDGTPPAVGPLTSFFAFDPPFGGGVRVAEGDLNGDGVSDYIAGAGPGGSPMVRIIDGALGAIRSTFTAFEPDFTGGVFVAAADVNGDGYVDVIAGSGEGRRGQVKVYSGRDLTLLRDTLVFDPSFTGGVHVAAGDVNGDGYADLIAGAGAGGADVIVLNGADLSVLWTVTPYPGLSVGAWVGAGDVTGDGFADVITGSGAGAGPDVRVFDGRTGALALNFLAYEPGFTGGVRVAAGDVTGDGRADIMTGPGPGRAPETRVFEAATATVLSNVAAYDSSFAGGVFVATAAPVNRMAIDLPADGAIVHGPFQLTGWALEEHPWNSGVSAIHVWAFPVAGGLPSFAGLGTLRDPRPDVAALYGGQYARAGFHVDVAGLAPGVYDVVVFGQSSASGVFNLQRAIRITVTP